MVNGPKFNYEINDVGVGKVFHGWASAVQPLISRHVSVLPRTAIQHPYHIHTWERRSHRTVLTMTYVYVQYM